MLDPGLILGLSKKELYYDHFKKDGKQIKGIITIVSWLNSSPKWDKGQQSDF